MTDKPTLNQKPTDKLTRLCDAMITTLEAHSEYSDNVHCAVFLDDGKMGGLVLHNYDDSKKAIVDLFMHLKAMFEANGMTLEMIAIPNDASGL